MMMMSDDDSLSTLSISTLPTTMSHRTRSKAVFREERHAMIDDSDVSSVSGFRHWISVAQHVWINATNTRKRRVSLYFLTVCIFYVHHRMSSVRDPFDETLSLGERFHNFFSPFTSQYEYTTINTKELVYIETSNPNFDAMQPPPGYPFHRWSSKRKFSLSGYPLNVEKFVYILSKLGKGEKIKTSLDEGLNAERSFHDFIRISGKAQPYIVRRGRVLRPFGKFPRWQVYKWHHQGHHIDWVTLLESAVSMAKSLEAKNPRMTLITQGEFPIIFDEFDYPWCADDLVPIFRLGAFVDSQKCTHQWPSLSLNYIMPQRSQWLKDKPEDWDSEHLQFDTHYPWEQKLPVAVWRGRYTGYRAVYEKGILPREQLVLLASNHPDIMDIQPVSWQYVPNDQTGELMQKSSDQIQFLDFMKYKAIVDIDSNGASTRFAPLLCMNSVVIKVRPRFGSYWHHELEPWVHYIPVDSDLSDLRKQVAFAVSNRNRRQVKQIIRNANTWCRRKMTWEQHTLDFLWTLLDYADLLDKSSYFREKWTNDRFAYRLPKLEMDFFEGELSV
ncbi:hypothetical protein ACHAWX_001566 [Stephanocyclus meneghinianus]